MKKKLTTFAAMVLSASLLLSGCSLFSKDKEESGNEATEVVEDYFKNLGKLNTKKMLKDTEDSVFAELELTDEQSEVMKAYFSKVKVEISEADLNEKKGKGTVTVSLTYVDLEEVSDDLDDDADISDLIDAIEAKKAPTLEEELDLSLVQNDDEEWVLEDDADIYDLLMDNFDCVEDVLEPAETTTEATTTTEAPTTTTEATTTTEPTTTTEITSETSDSDSGTNATLPCPGIVDAHIVDPDTFHSVCESYGLDETVEDNHGLILREYENEDSTLFITYANFGENADGNQESIAEATDRFMEQLASLGTYTTTDEWKGNTHLISVSYTGINQGNNIDIYIYNDGVSFAIIGIVTMDGGVPVTVDDTILKDLGVWNF